MLAVAPCTMYGCALFCHTPYMMIILFLSFQFVAIQGKNFLVNSNKNGNLATFSDKLCCLKLGAYMLIIIIHSRNEATHTYFDSCKKKKKTNFLKCHWPLISYLWVFIWRPDITKCTMNRTWLRLNELFDIILYIVPGCIRTSAPLYLIVLCEYRFIVRCFLFLLAGNHVNVGILKVPIDSERRPTTDDRRPRTNWKLLSTYESCCFSFNRNIIGYPRI